jgi:hypothetical protein
MESGMRNTVSDLARQVDLEKNRAGVAKTLRCVGRASFRSSAAFDLSCVLELDGDVDHWRCDPPVLNLDGKDHRPDFLVVHRDGTETLADAPDRDHSTDEGELADAAHAIGKRYRHFSIQEISGYRLANAKDLLRYKAWSVPLAERVRLVATLEQEGSMPLSECMNAIGHRHAVPFFAALVCQRFLEVDLDIGLIGPETTVRLIRL